jgi:large subunit ribosomal protein L18
MGHLTGRTAGRLARHARIRKKIIGMPKRPRLCVFRSQKHLYAQLIDDLSGKTLVGRSTLEEGAGARKGGTVEAAAALGKALAADAVKQGITQAVFDRAGYAYHGRVKALADAVRAGGIQV